MKLFPPKLSKLLLLIICIIFLLDLQAQQKPEILWDNYGVPHIYVRRLKTLILDSAGHRCITMPILYFSSTELHEEEAADIGANNSWNPIA